MHYERGEMALTSGDTASAEKSWLELIDLALVRPRVPGAKPAATRPGPAPPPNTPSRGPLPATLSQFSLAASLAQSAAEKKMTEISLRAMREVLSAGLPVPDPPKTGALGPSTIRSASSSSPPSADAVVLTQVGTRMKQLSIVWKQKDFPPAEVCTLLESAVFPASRPGEVMLYEQAVGDQWARAESVGRLLVDWSIKADRVEDLKRQVAARRATPVSVMAGEVLLVQLHVAGRDYEAAAEHLGAIGKQLETARLATISNLAIHAVGPALADARLVEAAVPLADRILSTTETQRTSSAVPTADSAIALLTRHHLKQGKLESAKTQVDRYLTQRQAVYGRYGGDYGLSLQRQDTAWAANELSRGHELATTLEFLARFADAPPYPSQDPQIPFALWHFAGQIRALPAAERYAVLREWTMPTEKRRSVRIVAGFHAGDSIPTMFRPAEQTWSPASPAFEPLSNLPLLVEAARETGKLDELWQAVEPLAQDKVPGAETLAVLVLLARQDFAAVEPRLQALIAANRERMNTLSVSRNARLNMIEWGEYLPVHAALDRTLLGRSALLPSARRQAAGSHHGAVSEEQLRLVGQREIRCRSIRHARRARGAAAAGRLPAAEVLVRRHRPPGGRGSAASGTRLSARDLGRTRGASVPPHRLRS